MPITARTSPGLRWPVVDGVRKPVRKCHPQYFRLVAVNGISTGRAGDTEAFLVRHQMTTTTTMMMMMRKARISLKVPALRASRRQVLGNGFGVFMADNNTRTFGRKNDIVLRPEPWDLDLA
jgi:hypothetical protein